MGEYALLGRTEIKIGTCENMYYLRASQADLVRHVPGNVDPRDRETRLQLRFRFPWPDEDRVSPGGDGFDPHDRRLLLSGVQLPAEVEHHAIQFSARPGYLISLPCPESPEGRAFESIAGTKIHRNGFPGNVAIAYQKWIQTDAGRLALVLICACGGCGSLFRIEQYEEALPLIAECRAQAKVDIHGRGSDWWTKVADRIEAGYRGEVLA